MLQSTSRTTSVLTLVLLAATLRASSLGAQERSFRVPPDVGDGWIEERAKAQIEAVLETDVFSFFTFRDRLSESGITFRHRIVDDAGKSYKMVHYDHGNGVTAADVDADGLPDLYFTTQLGRNELWRNLGGGRFEDVTETAGVSLEDRVSVAAAFADVDNDGDPDLYVTTVRMGNALFLNDGAGRFGEASEEWGVDYVGHSSGSVFFDYDRDGRLDLFVCNVGLYTTERKGPGSYFVGVDEAFSGHLFPERAERSLLYRNADARRFVEVSAETGLIELGWNGDAAVADINGDGYQDLFVLDMQGDDDLWINRQGETFVEQTERFLSKTPWGSMGVAFFDYDNDGDRDLLVTDMHSDMSEEVGPEREKLKARMQWSDEHLQGGGDNLFGNAFYRNDDGVFVEISDRIGAENYWPWGVSVGDLNADGFPDVFIASSMNYPFRYGVNSVLLNRGGRLFLDAEFALGVEPRRPLVTPWFELDCSGADRGHRHCAQREGEWTVYATRGTRSAVILDLEGDGDLDIVTNEFNASPQVLVSDLSEQRDLRFLKVRLVGRQSNRDGLGATVRVHAGDLVLTRVHDGKSGYLSQASLPLYFGLDDADVVDRVEVEWPSGKQQTLTEPGATNRLLVVEEP